MMAPGGGAGGGLGAVLRAVVGVERGASIAASVAPGVMFVGCYSALFYVVYETTRCLPALEAQPAGK